MRVVGPSISRPIKAGYVNRLAISPARPFCPAVSAPADRVESGLLSRGLSRDGNGAYRRTESTCSAPLQSPSRYRRPINCKELADRRDDQRRWSTAPQSSRITLLVVSRSLSNRQLARGAASNLYWGLFERAVDV